MSRPSYLIGLLGRGIDGSLSPQLHEEEAAALGMQYVYRRLDLDVLNMTVDDLPQIIAWTRRTGFNGLNVTHPVKQAIIPFLDDLSDEARTLNAVNTVVFADGSAVGHNTDWTGFERSFVRALPGVPTARVTQFGAGGAGAAVGYAILNAGAGHVTFVDPEQPRAEQLAASLCRRFGADRASAGEPESVMQADGVVNATPVGMVGHPGAPFDTRLLRRGTWVVDIVYYPRETELLRRAAEAGARTLNGGGMVVFQAVEAFRLFTGVDPNPERMLTQFETLVGAPPMPSASGTPVAR